MKWPMSDFASVYRSFKDINSFREEINQLLLKSSHRLTNNKRCRFWAATAANPV